jgi:purine-nucleoside phosphorylase
MLEKIKATTAYIKDKTSFNGKIAVILGSGLGGLVDLIEIEHTVDYAQIPHFPVSTVEGHKGKLVFGKLGHQEILVMQGRFHYYEGYPMNEVTFPIRVFKMLGIEYLIVTNASGATNYTYTPGDVMMITDHINLFGTNPLIGKNIDELGPRFPDMSKAYHPELVEKARNIAQKNNLILHEGTYIGLSGPSFETPAEYRFLHTIGGDSVGMSTVPEVIVANHMGMKVFGISAITNNGLCVPEEGNSHSDVLDAALIAEPKLKLIISSLIEGL